MEDSSASSKGFRNNKATKLLLFCSVVLIVSLQWDSLLNNLGHYVDTITKKECVRLKKRSADNLLVKETFEHPTKNDSCSPVDSSSEITNISTASLPKFYKSYDVKYSLNPNKLILLKTNPTPGYGNQVQCWNLAATFAFHWNRTLWLPYYGMSGTKAHNSEPYLMQDLYDISKIPIPFGQALKEQEYPPSCWRQDTPVYKVKHYRQIHAEEVEASEQGPFPNATCIVLQCDFADPMVTSAPNVFPEYTKDWWPYHSSMHDLAESIVKKIRNGTSGRILGMHIRRGDRKIAAPLFNCSLFGMSLRKHRNTVLCEREDSTWSWEHALSHMEEILNLTDFDAAFFASDEPRWVRKLWNNPLPLYSLADFFNMTFHKIRVSDVQDLVRELLVLSRVDYLIPSIPSSITAMLLRMKLLHNGTQDEYNRWMAYFISATRLYKNFTDEDDSFVKITV